MTSSKSPHRTVKGSSACGVTVVVLGPDVDAALLACAHSSPKGRSAPLIFAANENDGITLAQTIGAENVIIYADSPGLMSANPAHVSDAVPVRCASHEELMEFAGQQGSPIGDAAARQLAEHGISYEIRSAADDAGTVIRANGYEDRSKPVTAITVESGYGLISMGVKPVDLIPWKDLQMRVLERIASAGISLEMLQSFAFGTRFLAPVNRLAFMQRLAKEYGLAFHGITGCAKVCVVGTGIRSTPGVFYRSLRALAEHNVPVLHWGDSNVTLSFVVNDNFVRQAENVLHAALAPGSAITSGAAMSLIPACASCASTGVKHALERDRRNSFDICSTTQAGSSRSRNWRGTYSKPRAKTNSPRFACICTICARRSRMIPILHGTS